MDSTDTVGSRGELFERLEQLTADAGDKEGYEPFALLLIKLDYFRRFNKLKGYRAADQLLEQFTAALQSFARPQDYLARTGNAEFALILSGISHEGFATLAASRLFDCLKTPLLINDESVHVQAHAGVVMFPEQATSARELLQNAETALIASRSQLQPFSIFQSDDSTDEVVDWGIQHDMSRAIDLDQFELYFQPQINLKTGSLYGAEALIRWKHPEKGFIRPDLFIPIAEKNGQIVEITEWTINSALWFMKEWCRQCAPIQVAVNISTRMFSEPDFTETVSNAINLYGVDYHQLTLEITESALVEDMSASVTILEGLKELGVNVSIDDFGTGYSSLAYFKSLPADELKIDRSFIQYMLENQMDQHIVKTVIQLAHGFDLHVVAEGVEDRASYEFLQQIGCDIAQGYFIARPMPREEFANWVKERHEEFKLS